MYECDELEGASLILDSLSMADSDSRCGVCVLVVLQWAWAQVRKGLHFGKNALKDWGINVML